MNERILNWRKILWLSENMLRSTSVKDSELKVYERLRLVAGCLQVVQFDKRRNQTVF